MKTLALTLAFIGGLAAPVMAAPVVLSDKDLDQVTAGDYTVVYPGPIWDTTLYYTDDGHLYRVAIIHH